MAMHDLRKNRLAILPDGGQELLRSELNLALSRLGFRVLRVRPADLADEKQANYLPRLIEKKPELFLSVNMQGIIPGAPWSKMLLEADIPVLVWFVDNPWHLLSAVRDPGWKKLTLAVTDASFTEPLKAAGAQKVLHMPLAASPEHIGKAGKIPQALKRIVFAGRLAFPGLDNFFEGQEVSPELLARASTLLADGFGQVEKGYGPRPDFAWWVRELGLTDWQERFWPGKYARKPGKGAVECNLAWRASCIHAAQKANGGITVFGDSGWKSVDDLRPPVDYYTNLPATYGAAEFSLNLNSLLLPGGLSQRIFDVWPAGGFCLTDWNAGLEMFPTELTRPITFHTAEELPELAARLSANQARRESLRKAWEEHILLEHTYKKRLSGTLTSMGLL